MTQQRPAVSVAGGAGQPFGMFGVRGELFFAGGHLSVLAAAGSYPDVTVRSRLTGAASVRYYIRGWRHRVYADASWTSLYVLSADSYPPQEHVVYGPGVSVGYVFVAQSGFAATLGGGVAYDPHELGPLWDKASPLVQLGLGWTFHRHPPSRRPA
jgi:hypothetical protein